MENMLDLQVLPRDSDTGACQSCSRGKLRADHMGLDYPYDKVVRVDIRSMVVVFCPDCFKDLLERGMSLYHNLVSEVSEP